MEENYTLKPLKMHMYCWIHQPLFAAIAQADSVKAAREMLLGQVGSDYGPILDMARKEITENTPQVWHGHNAEFVLTDSAEVIELSAYIAALQAKVFSLESQLLDAKNRHKIDTAAGRMK